MSDISTFLGIFEEESESTQTSEDKPPAALNNEEKFFLQQMRDLKIKRVLPKFTPDGIAYSELASLLTYYDYEQMRALLESLARKGYIKKINYGTVALCPSCYSPVVMIVLSCPKCGYMKITKREVIKHRACGYTGYTEDFFDGIDCRCPQCGAIYDPAGHDDIDTEDDSGFTMAESIYECDSCGAVSEKPSITYNCIKCKTKFQGKDICFENPKGYELIDPAELASQRDGRQESLPLRAEEEDAITRGETSREDIEKPERPKEKPIEEPEPPAISEEPSYEEPEPIPIPVDEPRYEEPEPNPVPEEPVIEEPEIEDYQSEHTENIETLEPEEPEHGLEEEEKDVPPEAEFEDEEPEKKKGLFGGLFSKNEKKNKPQPIEKKPMRVEREVVRRRETSILLIEQNEETASKILESLERTRLQNVEVRHAFTGRLGLRELRKEHDAIILDAELDDIDPKLILLEMVRWKIDTPIIVICDEDSKLRSYKGIKLNRVEFIDPSEGSMKHISAMINELLS